MKPGRVPAAKLNPILYQRNRILDLLESISRDYDELARSGSYLTYRLATAKYAAEAKGILNVIAACDAYHYEEDII